MALKSDRHELQTDISFFMDEAATRGGVVCAGSTTGSGSDTGCGSATGSAAAVPGAPVLLVSNNASGLPIRERLSVMYLKVGETRTRTKSPLSSITPVMMVKSFLTPSKLVYWMMEVSEVVVCTGKGSVGSWVGADTPLSMRVLERFKEMRLKLGATRMEKWLPLRTMDLGSPINCFSSPA